MALVSVGRLSTPAQLHGSVVGWMTAKAHNGKEGLDGVRVSS